MNEVPPDFPRGITAATLPGTQPKFNARLIDGKFVVGMTPEELQERWKYCEDLARLLAERTRNKISAGLASDLEAYYLLTERRVRLQPWGLSPDEVAWLMKRTRELQEKS